MMIEMMRPAGPDLARRWLAALTLVPREHREAVVSEIERRIVAEYVAPERTAPGADMR